MPKQIRFRCGTEDSMTEPARPRQASTVVLLRPGDAGFEVFLTRRPEGMRFLGGMYCFPGGTVHQNDNSTRLINRCRGLDARQTRRIFGAQVSPRSTWGFWTAAVRELFEETGILLATDHAGSAATQEILASMHCQLMEKQSTFNGLLEQKNLYCDLSSLVYFSHWQTPSDNPVRFDTRFFLAVLPEGQSPLATSEEVIHSVWLTPDEALQRCSHGELPIIFPTFASLRTLADFSDLESLLAEFRNRYR